VRESRTATAVGPASPHPGDDRRAFDGTQQRRLGNSLPYRKRGSKPQRTLTSCNERARSLSVRVVPDAVRRGAVAAHVALNCPSTLRDAETIAVM